MDQETKWVSKDGTISIPSYQVAGEMEEIGAELAVLQLRKFNFLKWTLDIMCYISSSIIGIKKLKMG